MLNNYGQYPYGGYMPLNNGYNNQPSMSQQMSFVNGIEGAKGFIVPPNTSVLLMDSDAQQFFIKTADRNGMCNIKAYSFQEVSMDKNAPLIDTDKFVTREEFNKFIESVNNLITQNNAANETTKKALI